MATFVKKVAKSKKQSSLAGIDEIMNDMKSANVSETLSSTLNAAIPPVIDEDNNEAYYIKYFEKYYDKIPHGVTIEDFNLRYGNEVIIQEFNKRFYALLKFLVSVVPDLASMVKNLKQYLVAHTDEGMDNADYFIVNYWKETIGSTDTSPLKQYNEKNESIFLMESHKIPLLEKLRIRQNWKNFTLEQRKALFWMMNSLNVLSRSCTLFSPSFNKTIWDYSVSMKDSELKAINPIQILNNPQGLKKILALINDHPEEIKEAIDRFSSTQLDDDIQRQVEETMKKISNGKMLEGEEEISNCQN